MSDKPAGIGFAGLKARRAEHLQDLEKARSAIKTSASGNSPSAAPKPGPPPPRPATPAPSPAARPTASAPPPNPGDGTSVVLWVVGIGLVILIAVGLSNSKTGLPTSDYAASSDTAVAPAADTPSAPPAIEAHVVAERANVRSKAGTDGAIVTSLPQMQKVLVLGKEGTWSLVSLDNGTQHATGYISSKLLLEGSAQDARALVCDVASSTLPYSGEVLARTGYGKNRLTVNAGGSDVLVKLRESGRTALSFYVRNGESGVVSNVPDGTYQVMFASGEGFSRKCLEFVGSMSVSVDPNPAKFETKTTSDGYYDYTQNTDAFYTLTRQADGNFVPQTVDENAFRE